MLDLKDEDASDLLQSPSGPTKFWTMVLNPFIIEGCQAEAENSAVDGTAKNPLQSSTHMVHIMTNDDDVEAFTYKMELANQESFEVIDD